MADGPSLSRRRSERTARDVVYLEIGDREPGDTVAYPDDALSADGRRIFIHRDGRPY